MPGWRLQVPCTRETLRLAIRPDAAVAPHGLSLDFRVTSLHRSG